MSASKIRVKAQQGLKSDRKGVENGANLKGCA
jgi:hypothetical protein